MVNTISAEELEQKFKNDEDFTLVDVLAEDHFAEEHIPGAVNIPLDQIGSEAIERFDKDDDIVVYCKDEECQASPKAAEKLESLGFTNVKDFEAGIKGWKEAGNETDA